ncbi:MAG: mechanosensitive ion channel family protein [Bacilli bacterium]|nr:mechanosensitive ion channel family protein [Bacilli bacterium]
MDNIFEILIGTLTDKKLYTTLMILGVGILLYELVGKFSGTNIKKENVSKKKKTYLRLFNNTFKYIILFVILVLILKVNGINVTSLIAGLGLVSVIVGLALQDALKDIIMGFNIIVDSYFTVGDVLKIGSIEGKVIELGLKSTKLKDINTGNIFTTANRNISEALVLSEVLFIEIPLPYELKLPRAEKVINDIVEQIMTLENVEMAEYKGLQSFGESAIFYKIKLIVKPEYKPQTKRNAQSIIKQELDKNNISIPYTQIDIHTK